MKLTKAKLIKITKDKIECLGFIIFKDTITGFQGLFGKKINNTLYLTLGLQIHRYYDSLFTCNYYLGKTTSIAATWGDIPDESYVRPGKLLTDLERIKYFEDAILDNVPIDVWWDASNDKEVDDFFNVIEMTLPRFLNQPTLIQEINDCKDINKEVAICARIKQLAINNSIPNNYDFKFIPVKLKDNIPLIWFQAAEIAYIEINTETKYKPDHYIINDYAANAYRQYILDQMFRA